MDVILKEDVEKLGFKNEIVKVKNGFGRNFLIPKGLAVLATKSAIKILNETLKQREEKEKEEIAEAEKMVSNLTSLEVVLHAKVIDGGNKLFGSITVSQFVDALSKLGQTVNPKFVKIASIKELGNYEAEIRLNRSVKTIVPFKVEAEK
ncbi:MAG: 50S ribosomal protein L9 [Flavobacteriales bacterium]|nr:50S ribosomal protein L9 [Flavobacteriales bacterium]MBH70112.1 50S ribosomal protein L9 [Flavobacteriales bacterium]|tara:strand:- start:458 stop:904 length:447 start_codon:yes stop_codon:yes gene_type:complete